MTGDALWPLDPSEQYQGTADGPFAFKFTRDETLRYRVASEIRGTGMEGLTDSGVLMDFESGMSLHTRDVDQAGNALLRMTFDQSSLRGRFMDEQFSMEVTPNDAQVSHGEQTPWTPGAASGRRRASRSSSSSRSPSTWWSRRTDRC